MHCSDVPSLLQCSLECCKGQGRFKDERNKTRHSSEKQPSPTYKLKVQLTTRFSIAVQSGKFSTKHFGFPGHRRGGKHKSCWWKPGDSTYSNNLVPGLGNHAEYCLLHLPKSSEQVRIEGISQYRRVPWVYCLHNLFSPSKRKTQSPTSQKRLCNLKIDITKIHTLRCSFLFLIPKIILYHESSLITTFKYKAPTFIKVFSHTSRKGNTWTCVKQRETLQIKLSPTSN